MIATSKANTNVGAALEALLAYCKSNNWAGYDPYDALNSTLFRTVPLLDSRIPRLVLTQALKRLPLNLRPLLSIPKTQNPKALALFLSGFVKLAKLRIDEQGELAQSIDFMIDRLDALRSPGSDHLCWGYSFPWQTRTIVVPTGTANLVCTAFVANALFDTYDWNRNTRCLKMGLNAVEYLLNELYWAEGDTAGFSYPLPTVRNQVHNANFIAAALLCRAYSYTGEERFLHPALQVARCSAKKQRADGSWLYGEAASQRWIDHFHTGYNLCALRAIAGYLGTNEFDSAIHHGFDFYRNHFIGADGAARYFHDRTYPIDIHSVAQCIITLLTFVHIDAGNLPRAHAVVRWALTHMWDDRGFFYYRVLRSHTNRLSYMRWSQAWMFLALATVLEASKSNGIEETDGRLLAVR